MAPLAGVTDKSFRRICFEKGAQGALTEMVSVKGMAYHDPKTAAYLQRHADEKVVGLQLFGHEPEIFGQVLGELGDLPFAFIDLNMGCPAPKIVKNQDGSALMREVKLVEKLLKTIVKESPLPVTVKMRLGWSEEEKNFLEIGKIAEDAGVSAVALHGRTRSMFYSGKADWEAIASLKESLSIPVYGNGDIFTAKQGLERMQQSHVDGILIGRGVLGNPWIFAEMEALIEGRAYTAPTKKEIYDTILRHYHMVLEDKGERVGLLQMRKHAAWYLKGLEGNGKVRSAINVSLDMEEIQDILQRFLCTEN